MFAQKPEIDILTYFEGNMQVFKDKNEYLSMVVELNSILTKIWLGQIENRRYEGNSKKIADYYDKIQRGSIVSVQNPELIIKQKNY